MELKLCANCEFSQLLFDDGVYSLGCENINVRTLNPQVLASVDTTKPASCLEERTYGIACAIEGHEYLSKNKDPK